MITKKRCVSCLNFINHNLKLCPTDCREPCIIFDDGLMYIDIPQNEALLKIYLTIDIKKIDYIVYQSCSGNISINNLFTYYDKDLETFRIFPHHTYDTLIIEYNAKEVN